MKHILYTLAALLLSTISAQAQNMITEDLTHLGSFDQIDASIGWEITFTQSDHTSIKVSYSEEAADFVRMEVKNGRLILGQQNRQKNNIPKKIKLTATVSAPTLSVIEVTTGAEINFATPLRVNGTLKIDATTGAEVNDLRLTANGLDCDATTGASVEAELDVTTATVKCTTGADVDLSGKADTVTLKCTTGADISARALVCQIGDCSSTTGGDIDITIKQSAKVHTSTSGGLTVYGKPKEITGKVRGVRFK